MKPDKPDIVPNLDRINIGVSFPFGTYESSETLGLEVIEATHDTAMLRRGCSKSECWNCNGTG